MIEMKLTMLTGWLVGWLVCLFVMLSAPAGEAVFTKHFCGHQAMSSMAFASLHAEERGSGADQQAEKDGRQQPHHGGGIPAMREVVANIRPSCTCVYIYIHMYVYMCIHWTILYATMQHWKKGLKYSEKNTDVCIYHILPPTAPWESGAAIWDQFNWAPDSGIPQLVGAIPKKRATASPKRHQMWMTLAQNPEHIRTTQRNPCGFGVHHPTKRVKDGQRTAACDTTKLSSRPSCEKTSSE